MGRVVEEYAKEYAKETAWETARKTAQTLIENGVDDMIIHDATKLPLDVIAELKKNCE